MSSHFLFRHSTSTWLIIHNAYTVKYLATALHTQWRTPYDHNNIQMLHIWETPGALAAELAKVVVGQPGSWGPGIKLFWVDIQNFCFGCPLMAWQCKALSESWLVMLSAFLQWTAWLMDYWMSVNSDTRHLWQLDYYKVFLMNDTWEALHQSTPSNRVWLSNDSAMKTFKDAFQDAYFHFSHYRKANDPFLMCDMYAWANWLCRTAVKAPTNLIN